MERVELSLVKCDLILKASDSLVGLQVKGPLVTRLLYDECAA